MLKNYIQVALRNLRRHKFFSAINIFGLSISMSVCLGIIMLVADQMMYDRYNTNRDRIYRVVTRYLNPDGSPAGNDYSTSPQPLAETLLKEYTGVEKAVRIRRGFGNNWIELDPGHDVNIPVSGFFMDHDGLELFQYELEYGDAKTALKEPYSVVVTKAASKKLFKQDNPVGEVIQVGKLGEYKITGVLKDNGNKSHIVFEALASYSTIKSLDANGTFDALDSDWQNWTSGWVYMLLEEGKTADDIENNLREIAKTKIPKPANEQEARNYSFYLQNLVKITPGPFINNPIGPFMPKIFVYFFGGLALIVMLTSCFNYTNLSIARSLTRAREIGVRKVNGAYRYQIFSQFISESVVIALFALAVSIVLLIGVKPFLMNLKFAQILKWDLEANLYVYIVFILFSVMVGVLAGLFPAAILSKFQPIKVLKNSGGLKIFSRMGLRKSLLVVQFTLSLIFILSVVVLYNQLSMFTRADHGFSMNNIINVPLSTTSFEALKSELLKRPGIERVAAASHTPAIGVTYGGDFKKNASDEQGMLLDYFYVNEDYITTLEIPLVAGRNFDAAAGESNKNFMLLNEKAVQKLELKSAHEALGQTLFCVDDSAYYEVIGVVRDYNHQAMMSELEPMALRYKMDEIKMAHIKYSGSHDDAVRKIEQAWATVSPALKTTHKDFAEEVKAFYNMLFSDLVNIVFIISILAIFISCLGLLGMATYATETRLKEISIRKVLGSSNQSLILLLSKGFVVLLVIAIAIAVPAAWFINNLWLQQMAYRTEMSIGVILLGIGIMVGLGLLTIGSQTIRAAWTNPVDNLKND